jgi:hypothetical protein
VGDRQKTCGSSDCKKEWHRRKCAEWNQKNKACSKGNYLNKKLKAIPSEESESAGKSCSETKSKPPLSLKSGLNPMDLEGILSLEQIIAIEYILEQIVRRMLPQKRGQGE